MTVTASLIHLQELDAEIERRVQELAAIRRQQSRNPELAATEKRLEDMRAQERMAVKQQRALEADLAAIESTIKRDQARMYGGQIVDARELASLERELEHYGARRAEVEERVLETMEQVDGMQRQIGQLSRRVDALRQEWEAGRPGLTRQAEEWRTKLQDLERERDALAKALDPRSLQVYTRLRASAGQAVSALVDGVCSTCRVAVPHKDVQHARSGALVTCPNCARILHAGG